MSTINRSTVLVPSRMATPPPVAHRATRSGTVMLARAFRRHAITLIAVVLVVVAVALFERAVSTPGPDALPLRVIAVAGLGAAVVSMLLRRSDVRPESPSSRHRQPMAARQATRSSGESGQFAAARNHERVAVGAWRRPLLGSLAALGAVSLMLALVLRGPQSWPLLSAGLSVILALWLLAPPMRGVPRVVAAASTHSDTSATPATRSDADATPRGAEPPRDGRSLDWSADEIHDAALDSFPASDPPSWSPLRIGAPARASLTS